MTATIPFVNPVSQIRLAPGSKVTIPNISWQEFELILQQLGENRHIRLNYSKGTLESMVP
ncbi:MAG: Uma2 family endonuclease, partial [Moorea sp. SIO2B7]|nr:Uma2 family endonuclease [Moorena sp. SIO2B7]